MTNRWGVLAILSLARVSMGVHLQVVAAVAPFLMADLGLGYGEIGTLIGIFLLPGVAIALPGGLVSRRFGDARTLVGGMALLTAGTGLLAISDQFSTAVISRLIAGAGGTLMTMQIAKMTTDWFAGRDLATAIGILLGTFPLGIAAVMAGLPPVASAGSWQLAVVVAAASAVPILLVVAVLLRDPPGARASVGPDRPRLWVLTTRELFLVVLSGASFSLLNAGIVIFASFVPALLLVRGLDEVQASQQTSWTSWVMMLALPAAGLFLDRARPVTVWLLASAALTAAVCAALVLVGPAWLWIVAFGIVLAPIAIGAMALPGEVLRPESRATGFGIYFTTNYIGFALLPAIAGLLLDLTGSATAPIWFCGLLFAAIVPTVLWFRWVQRPIISSTIH